MPRFELQEYEPTAWEPVAGVPAKGGYARLSVDGHEVEGAKLKYRMYGLEEQVQVSFEDEGHAAILLDVPISNVPSRICEIELRYPVLHWPGYSTYTYADLKDRTISAHFHLEKDTWNYGRAPLEYQTAVVSVSGGAARPIGDAFIISAPLLPEGIRTSLDMLRPKVSLWMEQALTYSPPQPRTVELELELEVPDSIRVPCQQYLLYFIEFLRDLNIEATGTVSGDAGKILFSVEPKSREVALERIEEALRVYLRLYEATLVGSSSDLESQKLEAEIYHFRSRLALAAAIAKTQHATIEAQSITIMTQKLLIDGKVGAPSDREEFLEGALSLVPYKGKGFEANLPKIFRKLREFLWGSNPRPGG